MRELRPLIGRPWKLDSDPPNSFDCWSLVAYVRKTFFDRETPSYRDQYAGYKDGDPAFDYPPFEWYTIPEPVAGSVARFGVTHVGVVLPDLRVIHCSKATGVRVDTAALMARFENVTYWELGT